jgi:DNA-directed RNA polymerase specialized sigma24 family protein
MIERDVREHWWAAVAAVTRSVGDLAVAEDAVQEACLTALIQWPVDGPPLNPRAWLISTARHKALDRVRREGLRSVKETAAAGELGRPSAPPGVGRRRKSLHPRPNRPAERSTPGPWVDLNPPARSRPGCRRRS